MRRVGEVVRTAQGLAIVRVHGPADEQDGSGSGGGSSSGSGGGGGSGSGGGGGSGSGGGGGSGSGDASDDTDRPRIGTAVVDENLDDVGRVVDVFGPVERPYVAVSPADGVVEARLLGAKLYAR